MDKMGYIDFVFLGLIVVVGIRGFWVGFWRELFGILGLIVGIALASRYAYDGGLWFKDRVFPLQSETFATLIGFVGIFLLTWLSFMLIEKLLTRLSALVLPRYLNGILGALFGIMKAFVAIGILLHFVFRLEFMGGTLTYFSSHSILYPKMESLASKIVAVNIVKNIPTDKGELKQKIDEIKDGANNILSDGVKKMEQKLGEVVGENPLGETK